MPQYCAQQPPLAHSAPTQTVYPKTVRRTLPSARCSAPMRRTSLAAIAPGASNMRSSASRQSLAPKRMSTIPGERERGSRGMSLSGRCVQECPLCMACVAAKRACVVIARHCAPTQHARAAPRTTSRAPRWLPQSDPSIQFSPPSVLQAIKCHARSRWAEQAEGSAADQR